MEGEQTREVAVTRVKRRRVEEEQTGEVAVPRVRRRVEGGTDRRGDFKPG